MHPRSLPVWILWAALKVEKKLEIHFDAVEKTVPWASWLDTELQSSQIPLGVQKDFCLSNISSLWTGYCPLPFKKGFLMDLV